MRNKSNIKKNNKRKNKRINKRITKRKRYVQHLIALKDNKAKIDTTKINTTIKCNNKTNKNIFGLKEQHIIKDLLELKNTVENSTIKTIKN